ncbi:MAG: nickel pincer cofactor biosynthesis protein LarB [Chitinivibrionales bacterium]|nr:nickel pincer cofactor biosynthesis protein LarB [Chitinivibrionales bacterium]
MEKNALKDLLELVAAGKLSPPKALDQLAELPFQNLGFAKIDHHRSVRTGFPEVIFCQNKHPAHVIAIVKSQLEREETVFATRAGDEVISLVCETFPQIEVNHIARCFWKKSRHWKAHPSPRGVITIASAGTADATVAEEARCTIEITGHPCTLIQDVGVSGIHRLFAHQKELRESSVIIAVAGMEGALASVIAGYVGCPVIGVPTSVGYGSHLNGLVPLFAMLNSCASGLTVVNIDNGFGAGQAASMMNQS